MRRVAAFLITIVIAVGLAGLTAVFWSRSASFLARTWQQELEHAPDDQVGAILDRLAALGDAGCPALAEALGSSRECVAEAAAQVLRRQVARWSTLPAADAVRRQRSLAKALAERLATYGRASRHAAAEIVANLLSCLPAEGRRDDAELLAACTQVLRADAAFGGPSSTVGSALRGVPGNKAAASVATPRNATQRAAHSDRPRITHGGPTSGEPKGVRLAAQTAILPSAATAKTGNVLRESSPAQSQARTSEDAPADLPRGISNEPRRLSTARRAALDEGAAKPVVKGPADLRKVAERLHDPDPQQAEAARKALRDRGFSPVEIELAGQLTDPDCSVRRKLARRLLATPGIDAAPWLLELSRDSDAEVRLEAMTLLATTADPALLAQLRRLSVADPDERIQRLADRLSCENLGAGKPDKKRF